MFVVDDLVKGFFGNSAAQDQANAAKNAMDLQKSIYDQNTARQAPWVQGGQQSLAQLLSGIQSGQFNTNVDPQSMANDPGYQFRMQQGQQALQRSAAAKGNLMSGGFMKGLDAYSQGLASQEYGNAWNRNFQQNQANYGNLYNLSRMGQDAAAGLGTQGQGYANSMSSLYGALGNAQGAGDQAWGNAISGGIQDIGNGAMIAFGGAPSLSSIGGGGSAPSASSLYASNPGNYSLGAGSLQIPTQGMSLAALGGY